jgi:ATP-dependent protease ClpP protease subunit
MGNGFRIIAKGSAAAEVLIYEDIGMGWFGGVTAKDFAKELKALGKVETIDVRINSYGGDVFDGLTIYRQLVDHAARIVVHVDGIAASIASVIAMAGDEIEISESGFLMIHNAWGVAFGAAADMRKMADLLDTTTASIRDVYAARTGNDAAKVAAWMDEETWFTGAAAVEAGFADRTAANMKVAARFNPDKHKFRHAPQALQAREPLDTPRLAAMRRRMATMKLKLAASAA